jgi:hypothetical protein
LIGLLQVPHCLSAFGVPSAKSSTQWEARAGAKGMSRTMLINKKEGKMRLWDATNIINPTYTVKKGSRVSRLQPGCH